MYKYSRLHCEPPENPRASAVHHNDVNVTFKLTWLYSLYTLCVTREAKPKHCSWLPMNFDRPLHIIREGKTSVHWKSGADWFLDEETGLIFVTVVLHTRFQEMGRRVLTHSDSNLTAKQKSIESHSITHTFLMFSSAFLPLNQDRIHLWCGMSCLFTLLLAVRMNENLRISL